MKNNEAPKTIHRRDYQPYPFVLDSVSLTFTLEDQFARVVNTMQCRRVSLGDDSPMILDGVNLELEAITLNGQPVGSEQFVLDEKHLSISDLSDEFVLTVESRIYPDQNTELEGLYRSSGNFCTQCEAEGFRKITWYPDRPDVLSVFRVRIEGDTSSCPTMLSNGNKVAAGSLESGRHFVEWEDPFPKPSYLFALVAGDLECLQDTFSTASGRAISLEIYVEAHNLHKCDYAMNALKAAMRWDETVYGLEYDLDVFMIVAVDDFNMGAMENKGLNIFNSRYVLANQETATDTDFQGVEGVIAHEYFHNWTGNRITCRDWFQLSLKEGLTVFRDQQFSADMNSSSVKRINDVRLLRARQFPEDAGPLAHPIRPDEYIEINNFYTTTVYEKGAEVIRMIHTILGEEQFHMGMDHYVEHFDGQAATCEDFVRSMEIASGVDLTLFRRWYSQAGTPVVEVTDQYDENSQRYTIEFVQHCPPTPGQAQKQHFQIPIRFGLIDSTTGNEIRPSVISKELESDVSADLITLTQERTQVTFESVPAKPVPSLLRGFSAPVTLKYGYCDQALACLMASDTDDFNRWDASQRLYRQVINALSRRSELSLNDPAFVHFIDAFDQLLADDTLDPAFVAETLQIPGIESIVEDDEVIDIDGIDRAIRALRRFLATRFQHRFQHMVESGPVNDAFSLSSEAMGQRKLRNTALGYLGTLEPDAWFQRVLNHYRQAANMTDRMAAMAIISDSDVPQRQSVLDDFYDQWSEDRLVVDKWFSLQAIADRPEVVEEVGRLKSHAAFELSNPNRVRALIGAFAMSNVTGFHRAGGDGYQLLADTVLELDQTNPQIAARLSVPLGRWRRFDEVRQQQMIEQLERIADVATLSPDVFEIVSKSLKR